MTPPHDAVQIGCGNRGQTHARALADGDRFEFVAACDVAEAALRSADEGRAIDLAEIE